MMFLAVSNPEDDQGERILRVVIDGLIRYVVAPIQLHPLVWENFRDVPFQLPPTGSTERKCFRLEMVDKSDVSGDRPLKLRRDGMPKELSGIQGVVHEVMLEYSSFTILKHINPTTTQNDRLSVVSHPNIPGLILMKIAPFPDELFACQGLGHYRSQEAEIRNEILIHQEASPHDIAPRFLGLVTERGRGVIGFIMEYFGDAKNFRELRNENRAFTETEIRACLAVTNKLHSLGIYHGDLHLGNILQRAGGKVFLIDFQYSRKFDRNGRAEGKPNATAANEAEALEARLRRAGRPRGSGEEFDSS